MTEEKLQSILAKEDSQIKFVDLFFFLCNAPKKSNIWQRAFCEYNRMKSIGYN